MKYLFSFVLSLLCIDGFGQINGYIQWKADQSISWTHFQGEAQQGSAHHALTASGVSINMRQETADTVTISVLANFHPDKSWIKAGKQTDLLLIHERKHFDIAELFKRKLVKEIITTNVLKLKNVNAAIERLYNNNDKALLEYQIAYDRETEHSHLAKKQEFWNEKIERELEELKEYWFSDIKVHISHFQTTSK